jgi:hypothetical protein
MAPETHAGTLEIDCESRAKHDRAGKHLAQGAAIHERNAQNTSFEACMRFTMRFTEMTKRFAEMAK